MVELVGLVGCLLFVVVYLIMLKSSGVVAHVAVTTKLPMLDCLSSGCNICRANVWGREEGGGKPAPLKKKTRNARHLRENETAFQPACVTHDTHTESPNHNPLLTVSAHP